MTGQHRGIGEATFLIGSSILLTFFADFLLVPLLNNTLSRGPLLIHWGFFRIPEWLTHERQAFPCDSPRILMDSFGSWEGHLSDWYRLFSFLFFLSFFFYFFAFCYLSKRRRGGGGGGGGGEGGGRGGGGGGGEEEEEEDLEGRGCAAPFLSCNGRVCVRHSSLLRISSRYTLQTRAHLPCFFPFFFPFFPIPLLFLASFRFPPPIYSVLSLFNVSSSISHHSEKSQESQKRPTGKMLPPLFSSRSFFRSLKPKTEKEIESWFLFPFFIYLLWM